MANPMYGSNRDDNKIDALAAAYDSTSTLLSKNIRMGVKHEADFDTVANDAVIMSIPAKSLILNVNVINRGATELAVGTSLGIEAGAGGTLLTEDIKVLAAGTASAGDADDADLPYYWAAGGDLVWACGTNSTVDGIAVDVIVTYIPAVDGIS